MTKSTYTPPCGLLNKPALVIAMGLLLGISQLGYAATKATKLKVTGGQTVSYFCDNGKKLAARYYNLSDNSLSFVKLTLNGKIYTLPQVVSASGVRYTDEHMVEWWSKGDKAMLDEDVTDAKSKLVECAEATAKKAEVAVKATQEVKEAVAIPVKKTETVEKSKRDAAELEAKETAAKQAKKPEAAVQTKKDTSTAPVK
ncbi:conserved hypothetical protein [Crenothrix polyspora]|uniref:C-type lysozyme inhibitor domain-containing protein n=1 Tax=Crenothrix polyspora TaxID=360316 RepID=A0A1R4H605_9GAMM|nr:MliC family protein [Crenothrix polyspora]SJM91682.1 conserved hypothetical protein [Crenothrix polyspora]